MARAQSKVVRLSARPSRIRSLSSAVATRMLAPFMRAWSVSQGERLSPVPLPIDTPQATVSGPNKANVLLFGAGPAVGWGVLSHDLALPGSLARALSARTGRGVQVDLVADSAFTAVTALEPLAALDLDRYEYIVVVLGVNDAIRLTPLRRWESELATLLDWLEGATSDSTNILVTGIQPIRSIHTFDTPLGDVADRHARSMNCVTTALVEPRTRTGYVALPSPPDGRRDRHRESGAYVYWARSLANALAPEGLLDPHTVAEHRERTARGPVEIDEERRQRAVDELGLADGSSDARIDHLVHVARNALQTDSAIFSVLDHDRQIHKARSGTDLLELPRATTFCDFTIRTPDGMTVLDTNQDERFRGNEWVTGPPNVRFYAGFPIEAPDGQRVGSLCVFDSRPRTADEVSIELIEELALLIQRELWRYLPGDASSASAAQSR